MKEEQKQCDLTVIIIITVYIYCSMGLNAYFTYTVLFQVFFFISVAY